MKLTACEDIDAPINAVFTALCDFEALEKLAARRGAKVDLRPGPVPPEPGTIWDLELPRRVLDDAATVEISETKPPEHIAFAAASDSFNGRMSLDLMGLPSQQTRLLITFELQARTWATRLVLASALVTHAKLEAKFRKSFGAYVDDFRHRLTNTP